MIPQEVDGVAVIADEPIQSPLSTRERPIFFSHARELLLNDGRTFFACTWCGHIDDKIGRIRNHQSYECSVNPKAKLRRHEKMRGVVPEKTNPVKKPKLIEKRPMTEQDDSILAALELVLGSESQTEELRIAREERDLAQRDRDEWRRRYNEINQTLERVKTRLKDFM